MISWRTTAPGAPLARTEGAAPEPAGGEVLLRTLACGVCHSDVHLHEGAFDLGGGERLDVALEGRVLGHEIFGEVAAAGPEAEGAAVGDRRVVYPWIGCGGCPVCRRGEEHLCAPGRALGIAAPGGFADHVLVPHGRYLFDKGGAPDALAATYACSGLTAFSALKKAGGAAPGGELVLVGAGGVGLMALQIARAMGLDPVVADIDPDKLETAREAGAGRVFDAGAPGAAKAIRRETGGAAAAIDLVGSESSVALGLGCLRKGGRLIIVGLYGGSLRLPIPLIPMNARVIEGSYVGSLDDMGELMAMVRAGAVDPVPIRERPLAEAGQALADLKAGRVRGRQVLVAA